MPIVEEVGGTIVVKVKERGAQGTAGAAGADGADGVDGAFNGQMPSVWESGAASIRPSVHGGKAIVLSGGDVSDQIITIDWDGVDTVGMQYEFFTRNVGASSKLFSVGTGLTVTMPDGTTRTTGQTINITKENAGYVLLQYLSYDLAHIIGDVS
jgi:hypothetical protein